VARRTPAGAPARRLSPRGLHAAHELSWLALQNKTILYDLLFRASAATLLEVAADAKHLGAAIGFLSVLRTWGQNLLHHPHVYCVIPVGGLSPDGTRWVRPRYKFFLPVKVLSRVFRGKFVAGLKDAFRLGRLVLPGRLAHLADPTALRAFLRRLFRHDWVVYAKLPFGGRARPALPRALHASRRHLESSDHQRGRRPGHVSVEGLRARLYVADDDRQRPRIPAAILLARAAEGFRPDSLLWVSRESPPWP
jgi:hypothetical protein